MSALTPAMVHELAGLITAIAVLIIWPNGIGR